MILKTFKEIITGKSSAPMQEVEITTGNIMVRGNPAQAGDVITIPKADAEQLAAQGQARFVLTAEQEVKREAVQNLIPPPWQARPLPENWQGLPEPFHKLWSIMEKFRCAKGRADELEILFLRREGLSPKEAAEIAADLSRSNGNDGYSRSVLIAGWLDHRLPYLKISVGPEDEEKNRRIGDAMNRAYQAYNDLLAAERENFARLRFQCGDLVIEKYAESNRLVKEVCETGFQIFRERIAALRLGDGETLRLYRGTEEQRQFEIVHSSPPDLRFAWADPLTGEGRIFMDSQPTAMADHYRNVSAAVAKYTALLKEAKRQLSAARQAQN